MIIKIKYCPNCGLPLKSPQMMSARHAWSCRWCGYRFVGSESGSCLDTLLFLMQWALLLAVSVLGMWCLLQPYR